MTASDCPDAVQRYNDDLGQAWRSGTLDPRQNTVMNEFLRNRVCDGISGPIVYCRHLDGITHSACTFFVDISTFDGLRRFVEHTATEHERSVEDPEYDGALDEELRELLSLPRLMSWLPILQTPTEACAMIVAAHDPNHKRVAAHEAGERTPTATPPELIGPETTSKPLRQQRKLLNGGKSSDAGESASIIVASQDATAEDDSEVECMFVSGRWFS